MGDRTLRNAHRGPGTAVRAALIFSLEPVAAALFARFVGGDPLSRAEILGGGLIVAGVLVSEVVLATKVAPRPAPSSSSGQPDQPPRR